VPALKTVGRGQSVESDPLLEMEPTGLTGRSGQIGAPGGFGHDDDVFAGFDRAVVAASRGQVAPEFLSCNFDILTCGVCLLFP
jgi:hypothetical protein